MLKLIDEVRFLIYFIKEVVEEADEMSPSFGSGSKVNSEHRHPCKKSIHSLQAAQRVSLEQIMLSRGKSGSDTSVNLQH